MLWAGKTFRRPAKRGIQVTAVDRTEFLLNKAKETAAKLNLEIEFVLDDMRDFVRPGAFTLVLNMFTSFGFFAEMNPFMSAFALLFTF